MWAFVDPEAESGASRRVREAIEWVRSNASRDIDLTAPPVAETPSRVAIVGSARTVGRVVEHLRFGGVDLRDVELVFVATTAGGLERLVGVEDPSTLTASRAPTQVRALRVEHAELAGPRFGFVAAVGAPPELIDVGLDLKSGLRGLVRSSQRALDSVRAAIDAPEEIDVEVGLDGELIHERARSIVVSGLERPGGSIDFGTLAPDELGVQVSSAPALTALAARATSWEGATATDSRRGTSIELRIGSTLRLDDRPIEVTGLGSARIGLGPLLRFAK